jgi:hypothetical protein
MQQEKDSLSRASSSIITYPQAKRKENLNLSFTPYEKLTQNGFKCKTMGIKLLKDSTNENLPILRLSKYLLDMTPKVHKREISQN